MGTRSEGRGRGGIVDLWTGEFGPCRKGCITRGEGMVWTGGGGLKSQGRGLLKGRWARVERGARRGRRVRLGAGGADVRGHVKQARLETTP